MACARLHSVAAATATNTIRRNWLSVLCVRKATENKKCTAWRHPSNKQMKKNRFVRLISVLLCRSNHSNIRGNCTVQFRIAFHRFSKFSLVILIVLSPKLNRLYFRHTCVTVPNMCEQTKSKIKSVSKFVFLTHISHEHRLRAAHYHTRTMVAVAASSLWIAHVRIAVSILYTLISMLSISFRLHRGHTCLCLWLCGLCLCVCACVCIGSTRI